MSSEVTPVAQQRAKLLAERARAQGVDWAAMLEELRQKERSGEPSVLLRSVPLLHRRDALNEASGERLSR